MAPSRHRIGHSHAGTSQVRSLHARLCVCLRYGASRPTGDPQTSIPVTIDIDAAQSLGPLRPIWRFFGADEPNYATMKDGEKLLGELGQLRSGEVFFRTHNLL